MDLGSLDAMSCGRGARTSIESGLSLNFLNHPSQSDELRIAMGLRIVGRSSIREAYRQLGILVP